ncbi:hypothetical protein [Kutzneria kofuensis]|uniref:Lipoprotein LprG n=1 Tax=Kutzneria kofuensis TaxID=103725 RepID=A0A7W9NI42_9PSEU|nr:hypothetical protein [Kutzneria kofuensis]MBB5892733.1 hypothetical protein [Kutzneria kofuensis]
MRKTVVGFAVLVTLAACGGPGAQAGGPEPAADAAQLASLAKAGADKSKTVDIDAVVNVQQNKILMTGAALLDGANTQLDLKSSADSGDSEVRVVGPAVYLSLPAEARTKAGIGTPWLKLGGDDPLSKSLSGGLAQIAQQNSPTAVLDQLAKAGKITRTWQATLNGQPVTHYALVVDETKAGVAAKLPADLAAKLPKTADVDIWLNKEQLPVQVVTTVGDLLTSTVHYTNWGTKVDVAAPPADQVTDAATLKH